MKGNLKHAIELTFGHEGGYVNHPADPGGPTKFGITLGTLAAHRGRTCTAADVKALTIDEAAEILDKGYWRKVWGDDLPAGVDFCLFDYAVNSGPAQAIKSVQRVVGSNRDGSMGPKTLAAINGRPAPNLIREICDDRLSFMKGLKTWSTFGKGWTSRVNKVREAALDMTSIAPERVVNATSPVALLSASGASAKPTETAVSSTKQGKASITALIGSVAVSAPALVATMTTYQSTPWVSQMLPYLAFAGALAAIVGSYVGLKVEQNHIAGGAPQ
jgi:lysozyme family protein